MGVQIYRRNWPAMLIAVVAASLFALMFAGHAQTVASRFGGIPRGLPAPHLPALGMGQVLQLLPSALSLALLGGVESLLSALVADGMSGRFHRSNTELMAQGIANVVSALFGGIVATGTIARTATNIRAGAKTPVSGMLHSLFLLLFMLVAAPLAGFVPLSALAGVLAVVCWNMAGRKVFWANVKRLNSDSAVLMLTFLLTVFVDLTSGILAGTALAFMVAPGRFLNRPSQFER